MIFNKITIKGLYAIIAMWAAFIQTIERVKPICIIKPIIKIPMSQNLPTYSLKNGVIYSYVNANSFLRVLNKIQKPVILTIHAISGSKSLGLPLVYINLSHTRS